MPLQKSLSKITIYIILLSFASIITIPAYFEGYAPFKIHLKIFAGSSVRSKTSTFLNSINKLLFQNSYAKEKQCEENNPVCDEQLLKKRL